MLYRVPGKFPRPAWISVFLAFVLGAVAWGAGDPEGLTEITIGVNTDTARAALRAAGGREGLKIDLPDRWERGKSLNPGVSGSDPVVPEKDFTLTGARDPAPRWDDFTFPDGRVVTLRSKPWELFPSIDRVAAIYVKSRSDKDYRKSWVKGTQVEKFTLPKPGGEKR